MIFKTFVRRFVCAAVLALFFSGSGDGLSHKAFGQPRRESRHGRAALPAHPQKQQHLQPRQPELTLDEMISIASREAGISPYLLAAVVRQESSGNYLALSGKGAAGLTQLMPGTAARFGVQNRYNPLENLRGGARYLRWLLDYFGGDVRLALAGYNAGEGAVLKYGRRIPPYRETLDYVARIYPRFVLTATNIVPVPLTTIVSRIAAVASAASPPTSPAVVVVVKGSKNESAPLPAASSNGESRGSSVYFWQPRPRVADGVLPK